MERLIAFDLDMRLLAWASYRRTDVPFQSGYLPKSAEWVHKLLVCARLRANTGDTVWALMVGGGMTDSLGIGHGLLTGDWSFPNLQRIIPDTVLGITGLEESPFPLRAQSERGFRHRPSNAEVLQFVADITGHPIDEVAAALDLYGEDDVPRYMRLELGGVCAEAWRWFTGEEPTTRVVPDR